MYKDKAAFNGAFERLYKSEVIPVLKHGLSASVYTQLSDVEDEINGLFTFDRSELKVDPAVIQALNRELINSGMEVAAEKMTCW
jgi:hypothetical protein